MGILSNIKFVALPSSVKAKVKKPPKEPQIVAHVTYKTLEQQQETERWKRQMSLEQFILKEQRNAYKK